MKSISSSFDRVQKKKKKMKKAFTTCENNFFKQFVSYFFKVSTCSYNLFAKGWKRYYTK